MRRILVGLTLLGLLVPSAGFADENEPPLVTGQGAGADKGASPEEAGGSAFGRRRTPGSLRRLLRRLRMHRKRSPAMRHSSRGDFYLRVGRYRRALHFYRKALALDPKLHRAHFRLAFCLGRLKQTQKALSHLDKLLEARPRCLAAHLLRAEIHLQGKNLETAAAALKAAAAHFPHQPAVLLLRGRLALFRAEAAGAGPTAHREEALRLLTEASKRVRPGSALSYRIRQELEVLRYGPAGRKLAAARRALARQQHKKALKLLDEALATKKDLAVAHLLRGKALASAQLGSIDEAIASYKRAGAMKEAYLAIGELYYEKGELEDAEDWITKATKLDPEYQRAYYLVGLIHKELGEYAKSIGAWRKVMRIAPRSKLARWAGTKLQLLTGQVRVLAEGEVLDPSAERDLGTKLLAKVGAKWGFLDDEQMLARLNRIARKIIAVSDRPENLRYTIRIVKRRGVNAVTFPGGKILFFKGMLDFVKKELGDSDDAYAVILGHEIAHAALRHGLMKAKVISARANLLTDFSARRTVSSLLRGFTRANEFEADLYGALYAYRAGYNPAAALRFHERMIARREIPKGMSHPQHHERIARLREYLLEVRSRTRSFRRGLEALRRHKYSRAIGHFEIFLGVFPNALAARNNLGLAMLRKALRRIPLAMYKKSTDIDPSAKIPVLTLRSALAKKEKKALDRPLLRDAVAELNVVLRRDPTYVPALVNLGAALLDLGEREEAMRRLQIASRLDPENGQALNNLAVAHLSGGDGAKGRRILDQLAAKAHPDAIYNLGVLHQRSGARDEAAKAFARYLELDKDSGWAKLARQRLAKLKE